MLLSWLLANRKGRQHHVVWTWCMCCVRARGEYGETRVTAGPIFFRGSFRTKHGGGQHVTAISGRWSLGYRGGHGCPVVTAISGWTRGGWSHRYRGGRGAGGHTDIGVDTGRVVTAISGWTRGGWSQGYRGGHGAGGHGAMVAQHISGWTRGDGRTARLTTRPEALLVEWLNCANKTNKYTDKLRSFPKCPTRLFPKYSKLSEEDHPAKFSFVVFPMSSRSLFTPKEGAPTPLTTILNFKNSFPFFPSFLHLKKNSHALREFSVHIKRLDVYGELPKGM